MAAVKDGELRPFDAEEALLETSVCDEIYVQDSREISGVPGGMSLLNKIYGLVQGERCLLNIICDDKFEQSGACSVSSMERWRWWCLCTCTTSLLTPKQRWRGLPLSLEGKFRVKSMVEELRVEKARRTPTSLGVPTLSSSE